MSIQALDGVQLAMPVGQEGTARSFYRDVLGMREIPKPRSLRGSGGVWFRSGPVEVHLGVEAGFQPARKAHPASRVDDVDVFAAYLTAAGIATEPDDRYPRVRRFYVRDPFGNRLEFLRPVRPAVDGAAPARSPSASPLIWVGRSTRSVGSSRTCRDVASEPSATGSSNRMIAASGRPPTVRAWRGSTIRTRTCCR